MAVRWSCIWLLMLTCLASSALAFARELYVDPAGGGEYTTIGAAVTAAVAGDTVVVACGTYREPTIGIRKNISIRSVTRDPECVLLDGQGTHRIMVAGSMDATKYIEGFTFVNGYQGSQWDDAGALLCYGSSVTVRNCVFRDNTCASRFGGALAIDFAMTLVDCEFLGNSAHGGGAIYLQGVETFPLLTMRHCLFEGNQALWGGAIYSLGGRATIDDCSFVGNTVQYDGGAISSSWGDLSVQGCSFVANQCASGYGNVHVWPRASVVMNRCLLAFNTSGSAVSCYDANSSLTLTCCDIFGNPGGDWTSCAATQLGVNGNFWSDPLLCEPPGSGVSPALHANSPCAAANSPCGELIGSEGVGCDVSAVEALSWGIIKALYR